jgi:hypothetical protein
MEGGEKSTGTRDVQFNVVSVLYHALEAASTAEMYVRDAEEAGDQDLTAFFREAQESNRRLADRAKEVLRQRLA